MVQYQIVVTKVFESHLSSEGASGAAEGSAKGIHDADIQGAGGRGRAIYAA